MHVGLTKVTPDARSHLVTAYGPRTVVFTQSRFRPATKTTRVPGKLTAHPVAGLRKPQGSNGSQTSAATTANRLLDAKPYWAGDRIYRTYTSGGSTYVVQCTTAAEVRLTSGTINGLTAGHCASSGATWQQGYLNSSGQLYTTGTYGEVTTRHFDATTDAELVGSVSLAPSVWLTYNPSGNSAFVTQHGSTTVAKLTIVCADGSFTNESCGGTVNAVRTCANITNDDGTITRVCGLDQATADHRLVRAGDSGGPVILQNSPAGYAIIVGVISAMADSGKTLLFSDINTARSALGFTVVSAN